MRKFLAGSLAVILTTIGFGQIPAIPNPNVGSILPPCTSVVTTNCLVTTNYLGNTVGVASPYPTVTDGSPIAWNLGNAIVTNGIVTLINTTATRALNLTNLVNGGFYTLVIKQDATGGALMTLGSGCTWKVVNQGAGAIVLTAAASGIDILTFTYDGANCYAIVQSNFN
jgi:hypothetical protein